VTYLALGIVVAVLLWFVMTYNTLVRLRNQMKEGWSGIDVQLKRRYDLIPNLVETVKGYAGHERTVFEEVTKARGLAQSAQNIPEKGVAEAGLTTALRGLLAVAENYPELRANQNFMELQRTLGDIEDQLQLSRRYYNGTVRDMNIMVESLPSNIVANLGNFKPGEFFEIESSAEREAPAVQF
jgi:LemA protein